MSNSNVRVYSLRGSRHGYISIDNVDTGRNGEWETSVILTFSRKKNADCCIQTLGKFLTK